MAIATWQLDPTYRRPAAAACAPGVALRLPRGLQAPVGVGSRPRQSRAAVPAHVRRRLAALALLAGLVVAASLAHGTSGAATGGRAGARPVAPVQAAAAAPAWEASVVVGAGDTVWEIALPHAPAGTDPQLYVAEVLRHNGLQATAVPVGTVIRLP